MKGVLITFLAHSSPYVRKTVCHALPKIFVLDPEQKDELITIANVLLHDKSTMVVGSAVAAWNEICPDRLDLLHPVYRSLVQVWSLATAIKTIIISLR